MTLSSIQPCMGLAARRRIFRCYQLPVRVRHGLVRPSLLEDVRVRGLPAGTVISSIAVRTKGIRSYYVADGGRKQG